MQIKLDDAIYNEQIAKTNMIKSKIFLKEFVKPSSLAGYEFERLVDQVWRIKWIKNSRNCNEKIPWLLNKQNNLVEDLKRNKPSMKFKNVQGENISKKDEEEMQEIISKTRYKDIEMEGINEDKKVINLGFENVNSNMENILSKPPGYTVYRKIIKEKVELDYDEAMSKMRWPDVNSLEENGERDEESTSKDSENTVHKNFVTFENKKATDMKLNKRVKIAQPLDIAFETKCSNLKIEILKSVDEFQDNNKRT